MAKDQDQARKKKKDVNDVLKERGRAGVQEVIDSARPYTSQRLADGSTLHLLEGGAGAGAPPPGAQGDWRRKLLRDHNNRVCREVGNVIAILSEHEAWRGVLRWNEFTRNIVIAGQLPFSRPAGDEWTDEDTTRTRLWLAREPNLSLQVNKDPVQDALTVAAQASTYHPVREYLNGLTWDGVPRVEGWLIRYAGAADTPYVRMVGIWWVVAMVARVFQPGCKVDTVPILEGPQGWGKSSLCRMLAVRSEWFSDTEQELGSKDSRMALRGKWLIELGELSSLVRGDPDRLKQFLAQQDDKYRPAFGRHEITQRRQCVFVGTVNPIAGEGYLRDPTGLRRFLPVRVTSIDLATLERERDQLWAEAVHLYHAHTRWWPETAEELATCRENQDERQERDPWENHLRKWIADSDLKHQNELHAQLEGGQSECLLCERATTAEALKFIGVPPEKQDMRAQKRVVVCMKTLGWEKLQRRLETSRPYVFRRLNESP